MTPFVSGMKCRIWGKTGQLWGKVVHIGSEDIDEVWLLPPATIGKVRNRYLRILDDIRVDEKAKRALMNEIEDFAGSREDFEAVRWGAMTWASGGSVVMEAYSNFTAFMVVKAIASSRYEGEKMGETETDREGAGFGEKGDESIDGGCFAYLCR